MFLSHPSGSGKPPPIVEAETLPLDEMLERLTALTDDQWGLYAFSREPLRNKFAVEQRLRLTRQCIECGRQMAGQLREKEGALAPGGYARRMGLQVEHLPQPGGGAQVLFAQFLPPDKICIYDDCLEKAQHLLTQGQGAGFAERDTIADILLAHELFHVLEERNKDTIYTQQEWVALWSLGRFRATSPISCLGEIAAMAFAKELCGLSVSPYLLDVLLVYGYDAAAATGLYQGILRVADGAGASVAQPTKYLNRKDDEQ